MPRPVSIKVAGDEVAGGFVLIECTVAAGDPGPPAHIHRDGLQEFWYVLEGELRFLAGNEWTTASAGTFVHVPAGAVHTFANPGTRSARFIGIFSPAHGLNMLREFATAFPVGGGPPDAARIESVFAKYSIEVVRGEG